MGRAGKTSRPDSVNACERPNRMKTIPAEKSKELTTLTSASYEDLVREMLVRLGEDPSREGLAATPERVHKAMKFLTKGY